MADEHAGAGAALGDNHSCPVVRGDLEQAPLRSISKVAIFCHSQPYRPESFRRIADAKRGDRPFLKDFEITCKFSIKFSIAFCVRIFSLSCVKCRDIHGRVPYRWRWRPFPSNRRNARRVSEHPMASLACQCMSERGKACSIASLSHPKTTMGLRAPASQAAPG